MIYSIRINNFSYLLFLVLFFSYCDKKDKKIIKVKIEYDSSKYIYKGVILFSKKQSNFIASIEKKHKSIVHYDCNGTVNTLYIEEFNESKLTDDIYSLRHLEFLRIESMYLKKFPDLEKNFSTLKELHLNGYGYNKNSLGKIIIPPNLRNLETLKITGFDIDEIIFPNNSRIKNLIIGNCKLNKFPQFVEVYDFNELVCKFVTCVLQSKTMPS